MDKFKIGDFVIVTAKVDYYGEIGEVVSINELSKHPYRVSFYYDNWAHYSESEICKIDNLETM